MILVGVRLNWVQDHKPDYEFRLDPTDPSRVVGKSLRKRPAHHSGNPTYAEILKRGITVRAEALRHDANRYGIFLGDVPESVHYTRDDGARFLLAILRAMPFFLTLVTYEPIVEGIEPGNSSKESEQ